MIFYVFLCQVLGFNITKIQKTIYLIEGEKYKVYLDSIFQEGKDYNYSFQYNNKGFNLDTLSLELKSNEGVYSKLPTKILRQRQLINLEDYQGLGQFGILDQYDQGHRICYNDDAIINLDQCIEFDNTSNSYDFVFIDRNTIAVSMVRVADKQFGVRIYQNQKLMNELYFNPSKTYKQVKQTIIEYCIFELKQYLLFGVTEVDSNIEFLEIQDNFQIVNTNKVIDKSLLSEKQVQQVYDIKGTYNKVYVVYNSLQQDKLIISFTFNMKWISEGISIVKDFRGLELGYSFTKKYLNQSSLLCNKKYYNLTLNQEDYILRNLSILIKPYAKIKYTLNYLIVLQDNLIIASNLYQVVQRTNIIEGSLLQIDVDFQNDVLIVFTDSKIMTFYLKHPTLSYSSNIITTNLDQITILAVSEESQQIANIYFQVLSKDDYSLYELQDLTQDLYYNLGYQPTKHKIPLNGISGPAIQFDFKVDGQVQFLANYLVEQEIQNRVETKTHAILEQLITVQFSLYVKEQFILFRQLDDFTSSIQECYLRDNIYYCPLPHRTYKYQNQKITFQNDQLEVRKKYALLESGGLQIHIEFINNKIETTDDRFVDFKLGTDRLFIYTEKYIIKVYRFPIEKIINILDLSLFGQPQGEVIKKLWVNQAKTNLIVITFGEDLIIGRFTIQFIFIQRITIKWVIDVAIIADNKFIVLSTDKTNKKLTQYIIQEGKVRIQRELSTYGYIISSDNILCDYLKGQIIIQAQKDSQKALLIFGDTELTRDSLLKIIYLQDDEFAGNIIYINQQSCLFKRSKDGNKNSSLLNGINNNYKEFEINLTQIPNKFSQQLQLEYIFSNQFSQNIIKKEKNLYLQYQFQNIIVKQPNQIINYKNEDSLKITIKPETFQGQVRTLNFKVNKDTDITIGLVFNFTTRFKNEDCFLCYCEIILCKYAFQFERILCLEKQQVTYYNLKMEIISSVSANILQEKKKSYLIEMILRNDESFALIRTTENELILIAISQNQIKLSHQQYWKHSFNISLFYKDWLVLCDNNQLRFFKFQSYANDLFLTQQFKVIVSNIIQAIQYDPFTLQIFYITGNQNLYHFKCSLEGDTIHKYQEYSFNLTQLLQSLKIYQKDLIIQFIKIITQQQNSQLLISTSYGNIWNITIPLSQDSQINNMYIANGPYQQVYDILLIDNYMLVKHKRSVLINDSIYNQRDQFQSLYKNTNDWQLNQPYLPQEVIKIGQIIGLFKNDSQIVFISQYGGTICQTFIDDEVSITIKDLKLFPFGNLSVIAKNGYGQAQVNFQIKKQTEYIWIVLFIIILLVIVFVLRFFKRKGQTQNNQKNKNIKVQLQ